MSDEAAFPRPWLNTCYLRGADFLYAVKRIAAVHGWNPARDFDAIVLGMAAQNIRPVYELEQLNRGRRRKLDPEKYVLTTPEVLAWLAWYEKAWTEGNEAALAA